MTTGLLWFRQDLRLGDNPALQAALDDCDRLLCVYIHDTCDTQGERWPHGNPVTPGAASRVWLHHSLAALEKSVADAGSRLLFARGDCATVLRQLVDAYGIQRIYWSRCYDPLSIRRDTLLKQSLSDCHPVSVNSQLLLEPARAVKANGDPYRVFTPFWKQFAPQWPSEQPLPRRRKLPQAPRKRSGRESPAVSLDALALLPDRDWHAAMMAPWAVGEVAATRQLREFLDQRISDYGDARDRPGVVGTSRLSVHLHFGEISPRQVLHAVLDGRAASPYRLRGGAEVFARELYWREFAYNLLYHFPHTLDEPLDQRFADFPWESDYDEALTRWQRGLTGVPIVDAGMRELWHTGWMHNRVRMIVASYLVKNLLIPWQQGEAWFRDTLIDADLASNALGWQWVAGCGADAAPYFRVFNPVLQGERFDAAGKYVRRWLPELADVPAKHLHQPWALPTSARTALDYPDPLVELKASRQRALMAYDRIKGRDA